MRRVILGSIVVVGLTAALGCSAGEKSMPPPGNPNRQPASEEASDQPASSNRASTGDADDATATPPATGSKPQGP